MTDIATKIKTSLRALIDIKAKYIINEDRLRLNSDRKTHDLITIVYAQIAPEKVLDIFVALNLCNNTSDNPYSVGYFYTRLDSSTQSKIINAAYQVSNHRQYVDAVCDELAFFTTESLFALEKLATTI